MQSQIKALCSFPVNPKCIMLECKGLWFCHWFFKLCSSKQIFRDPVLHCWNGTNELLVCSIVAEYGFLSEKLYLLLSFLLTACKRMDKIIWCSAEQKGSLWTSALLPTNADSGLQHQSFQALYSQTLSFSFSEQ